MKYVVAVSGGVDSMVLLDMMIRAGERDLIVAHFDHGIRADSFEDAELVKNAAQGYGVPFAMRREKLGRGASEAHARERRYRFLRGLATKHNARIVTAHHLDDLVETVAINMTRGTGWRGLAVLDSDCLRPLLDMDKQTLIAYAKRYGIAWREDSTNQSDAYLRNRIRKKASDISDDTKRQLRALHARQRELKGHVSAEVRSLVGSGPKYERYFFTHVPAAVAVECLRDITDGKLTRPQLVRALHAIKVAKPNATYEAGEGIKLHFSTRQFSL